MISSSETGYAAYSVFDREDWSGLRSNTPLTLSESDLSQLQGVNEQISLRDVEEIYLPLSRLVNLHYRSAVLLGGVRREFLGHEVGKRPYVLGIAGSVAVGKSTFARTLRELLAHWPDHPSVALVTTDGFLYPNATLIERGLMGRKGFPESYDRRRMIEFLAAVKNGAQEALAPVYSHQAYDILSGQTQRVRRPDILIFEGLNVLQTQAPAGSTAPSIIISDFFDLSLYLDADEGDIEHWYVRRFLRLQRTVFQDPKSYFHHYRDLSEEEATTVARGIWRDINLRNLVENILPTRERADVVLRKRADHSVGEVWLRQL